MGIKIEGFSEALANELRTYTKEVIEKINETGAKIARDGAKKLRQTSPKKTKEYSKGWSVKKQEVYGKPTTYIIHNKKKPGLAHLLEKGHAKRGGGRTKPIEHIKPVEEEVIEQYTQAVEEAIKGD